jgi:hypothetical protein
MKKISQIEPALRQPYIDQINQRWGQLYSLEKEWHEKAWKYLFLTNSGGAVAMLSFLGGYSDYSSKWLLSVGLSLFVLGVIVVGICIAMRYHRIAFLFKKYKEDANNFLTDKSSWEDVIQADEARVSPTKLGSIWGNFWPYLSFACFIVGSLVGGYALITANL